MSEIKAYFSAKITEITGLKLVILSSRFPYPIEKGDKLRLYHQMKCLAENHELHLFSLSENTPAQKDREEIERLCKSVDVYPISGFNSMSNGLRGLINKKPFQVNYFYSKTVAKEIQARIKALQPDAIFCQLLRMAEYVKDLNFPKVLDYMDCFSLNYKGRSKLERFPIDQFFKIEAKRLQKFESELLDYFDDFTIISNRDRNEIQGGEDIKIISNGIDIDFFHPLAVEDSCDLLFVGNMGYHPNVLAAHFLVIKIKPRLKKSLKIKIAGARPSKTVMKLNGNGVEVTGWVKDIRKAYAGSKIFVAPIFSGAGQQNKILEAMAMGLICITTPMVNESIGGIHNKHLLIAKNTDDFVFHIHEVYSKLDDYQEMRENARTFVKDQFSWSEENKKLNDIIIKAAKNKQ